MRRGTEKLRTRKKFWDSAIDARPVGFWVAIIPKGRIVPRFPRLSERMLEGQNSFGGGSDCVRSQARKGVARRVHRRWDFGRYPVCGLVGNAPVAHAGSGHGAF